MSEATKLACTLALSGILSLSFITPSHAFRMTAPEPEYSSGSSRASFAGEGSLQDPTGDVLLSQDDIRHIKWCAQRYRSYHATDNTYEIRNGVRTECRSPD